MFIFIPRLTAPSNTDKNWIQVSYGGYNRCVLGNPSYGTGSVLSNCTGYAWGRWYEILGYPHNLSINQASIWYTNTTDGYQRAKKTPKLGAIACWSGGEQGNGHVAVVEQMTTNANGTVTSCVVSESVYGGARFSTKTIRRSNSWYIYDNHTFQGFIYLPVDIVTEDLLVCFLKKKRRYY